MRISNQYEKLIKEKQLMLEKVNENESTLLELNIKQMTEALQQQGRSSQTPSFSQKNIIRQNKENSEISFNPISISQKLTNLVESFEKFKVEKIHEQKQQDFIKNQVEGQNQQIFTQKEDADIRPSRNLKEGQGILNDQSVNVEEKTKKKWKMIRFHQEELRKMMVDLQRDVYEGSNRLDINYFYECLVVMRIISEDLNQLMGSSQAALINNIAKGPSLINEKFYDQRYMNLEEIFYFFCVIFESITCHIASEKISKVLEQFFQKFHKNFFRSASHFHKYLFENRMISFEKIILQVMQRIYSSEDQCKIYTIQSGIELSELNVNPNQQQQKEYQFFILIKNLFYRLKIIGQSRCHKLFELSKKDKQIIDKKINLVLREDESFSQRPTRKQNRSQTPKSSCLEVYDRLYVTQNKHQKLEEDLQMCTFSPQINRKKVKEYRNSAFELPGVINQLDRMKKAQQIKERQESFFINQQNQIHEKYFKKHQREFNMSTTNFKKNDPIFYMDVNVGNGKLGRIGIRKDDNIFDKVKNFAIAYQLKEDVQQNLVRALEDTYRLLYQSKLEKKYHDFN